MPDRQTTVGSTIHLRTQFKDDYTDPTEASNVYVHIFDPDADYTDLSEAYVVSGSPTYLGQGLYDYEFTVPVCGAEGTWRDYWEGDLLCQSVSGVMSFDVMKGGVPVSATDQLSANDLVELTVASGIRATDGTSLSTAFESEFMTTASPYYSSPRKVRLEVGGYIGSINDYTIQMAILDASLEADALNFTTTQQNSSLFKHARYEYVTCVASAMLLTNVGSLLLRSKRLADLQVTYDTNGIADTMDKLRNCMDTWKPQLIAGGGFRRNAAPHMVVKGSWDPDRPYVSRSWEQPGGTANANMPAANTRIRESTQRRHKRTWTHPNRKKLW